jgi:hypothetical protein
LPTRYLTSPEVLAFRDEAFLRYYRDPGYLAALQNRFGRAAVAHIEDMTSYQLDRGLLNGRMVAQTTLLPAEEPAPSWRTPLQVLATPANTGREGAA